MIILDTDVLTIVQRASGKEYQRLVQRLDATSPQPVFVTIVSFEEQMRGWLAHIARAKTLERQIVAYGKLRSLIDDFRTRPLLDFDERAAVEFRRLIQQRIRIGTMDLRIAAIALTHRATLVTRNSIDFGSVPGLTAEDWTL